MDIQLTATVYANGLQPSFDASIMGGDFATDDGLATAVIVSLFTDRRAHTDDILPDSNSDRRGWWGDSYSELPNDLIGSRLWLLQRERDLPAVAQRAKIYIEEALQWLVDDGVVASFTVDVQRPRPGWMLYIVDFFQPGQAPRQFQFTHFWAGS